MCRCHTGEGKGFVEPCFPQNRANKIEYVPLIFRVYGIDEPAAPCAIHIHITTSPIPMSACTPYCRGHGAVVAVKKNPRRFKLLSGAVLLMIVAVGVGGIVMVTNPAPVWADVSKEGQTNSIVCTTSSVPFPQACPSQHSKSRG